VHNFISSNEVEDSINNILLLNTNKNGGAIELDKKYGDIRLNQFNTISGISYFSFEASFHEDTIIEANYSKDTSFLSFNTTANSIDIKNVSKNRKYTFDSNLCWHGRQFDEYKANGLYCKNRKYIAHNILIDNKLFDKISSHKSEIYKQKPVFQNESIVVNYKNKLTHRQRLLLSELLKTPYLTDSLQSLYLESKILDLICTTIDETTISTDTKKIYLNKHDLKSLEKAKEVLLKDISNPPSLKELAHKVAINEFKLKKGFKQLFGNTVYGLLKEHRLSQAKLLLERGDISVSEAASLVGYKSIGHFSVIFKKNFGVFASEITKSRKFYY
jgi:AraC-like DNA-binding protein